MKTFKLLCLMAICFGVGWLLPVTAHDKAGPPDGVFDTIKAKSITVTSEDGKRELAIVSQGKTVGLWVTEYGEGHAIKGLVSLVGTEHGTYIGVGPVDKSAGCNLAFYVDKDGGPVIQVAKKDKVAFIEAEKLFELAK